MNINGSITTIELKGKKTKEINSFIPNVDIDHGSKPWVDLQFCQKNTTILIEMEKNEFLVFARLVREEEERIKLLHNPRKKRRGKRSIR